MKKNQLITCLLSLFVLIGHSQTKEDLFKPSNIKVSWLGIDFSHVKLIGEFSQFADAGNKSSFQIRDQYFPGWNNLILSEPDKYDIKGMLRKSDVYYDIDMIMSLNSTTAIENLESNNNPNYGRDDINDFVTAYNIKNIEGIGVLFIAESLNKNTGQGLFHFVAINLKTKEVLIHERLIGEPGGFGLRNYWGRSIYNIMKEIKTYHYNKWKNKSD